MLKEEWDQILQGVEVRQNLSKIRQEIKDRDQRKELCGVIAGKEDKLIILLESEDAKIRKNTALLMGDLGSREFLRPIWNAYLNESQLFVRSSYLTAIGNFDYREYLEEIKDRLDLLQASEMTAENQKHRMAEMRELSALVLRLEGVSAHRFTGWDETYDIVLLTNRNFTETTRDELITHVPEAKIRLLGAGVMGKVDNLNWAGKIRTYQELLFVVRGIETCRMEPEQIARTVVRPELIRFLAKSHAGKPPYYFRLEMKSKRDLGQKSVFLKRLSAQIELLSDRQLVNTTDNYEFELRLIENKQGDCNIMIKLFTLKDVRFTYRREAIPTSIRPVNAALTVALAREYMKEGAQVLDPFCGVGTMLIERHKAVRADTTYGIDLQEEAIIKARANTEMAGQVIHYVNRDFFQFRHAYRFDEIITNMPFQIGRFTEEEVVDIYERFFPAAAGHLKDEALVVLYSHNRELVRRIIPGTGFHLLKEYEIAKKEGTYVMIINYRKQR